MPNVDGTYSKVTLHNNEGVINDITKFVRPKTLDEVVDQKHLLAHGKPFRRLIENSISRSHVLYSSSGTGITTVDNILASQAKRHSKKIIITASLLADLKPISEAMKKSVRRKRQHCFKLYEV